MKTTPPRIALHQLSLYNTGRMRPEDVIAAFAARKPVFDRILADITAESPSSRAQHHLIIGQRGMGKTMLLARVAAELRKTALGEKFIPLVFAEEQYAVDRLSKFWLNCLDSLADARELAGDQTAVDKIDDTVERLKPLLSGSASQDESAAKETLAAFLEAAQATGQRPVLLVDNLQIVFERLEHAQQHSLRELLMRPGGPILIGASPSLPSESQDYGAAFYDHFKVHYLRPLELEEMKNLMLHLAEAAQREDVRNRVLQHPARLAVLRQLTGGNPRTTVTLFFLYAEDFAPNVFGDLENLLDRVTPLYKARFEELTPQQQVIASAICNHWDPITSATIAENTGLPPGTISAQLDRLEKTGVIEKVGLFEETRAGFQIAERFFNIWFLMRSASRRQRREVEFLTRFLQSFYEAPDRAKLAHHLLNEHGFSSDRYIFSQAVAASLDHVETAEDLIRHAHLDILQQRACAAHAQLEELIDFSTLPPATLEFHQLRQKIAALVPANASISPQEFADKVLGDRSLFITGAREQLAARTGKLSAEQIKTLLDALVQFREIFVTQYSEEAIAWFSHRLASGQLQSVDDAKDWNRAFKQGQNKDCIRLMVDTLPERLGSQLTDATIKHVQIFLEPASNASAQEWFNWGHDLHVKFQRYTEAEAAYRGAIVRDLKYEFPWNGLGSLFTDHLQRYDEAETALREAILRNPKWAVPCYNLGNLLAMRLQRYSDAEIAYREAIARDPKFVPPWNNLGYLLQNHLQRYAEAEAAYREAITRDPKYASPWNGLGNLYCDYLHRYEDAAAAFAEALRLDPENESVLQNLIFLHRDFLGEGNGARRHLEPLAVIPKHKHPDTTQLHHAVFAAYESNWGLACDFLNKALELAPQGFGNENTDDWMRTSAVLLHLNYGSELLTFLEQRSDSTRLRPWYEALRALHLGDRRHLQNIAPEIRTAAEKLYNEIERRLKALPAKTSRRPVAAPVKRRRAKSS